MMCAQKQLCQQTRGEEKSSFSGLLRVGQKNISVLEEVSSSASLHAAVHKHAVQSGVHVSQLLCLDEEITSSLESEVLASQDITLTPGGKSSFSGIVAMHILLHLSTYTYMQS